MSDTQPKMAIRTSSEPLATKYEVMFDREVEHASEWQEEFYVIRNSVEGDLLNIRINNGGGCVSTLSAFQHAKKNSPAHFHGILEGEAFSAGGAIFLLCDTHEVGDLAELMVHTSNSGRMGHSQGMESYGLQTAKSARNLVELIYTDFLTEEEIEDVLKGKEMWMGAQEIRERLEKRAEIREQRMIEQEKESWTEEVYVAQAVQSILEDCEALEYDPVNLVAEMFKLTQEHVESLKEAEDCILDDSVFEEDSPLGSKVVTQEELYNEREECLKDEIDKISDIKDLKEVARLHFDYNPPHNIGLETLRKKLLALLE